MTPEIITDWHLRAHDQVEERLKEVVDLLTVQGAQLSEVQVTLATLKGEKRARQVAGSYLIPGAVSVVVAYAVKRLGLL